LFLIIYIYKGKYCYLVNNRDAIYAKISIGTYYTYFQKVIFLKNIIAFTVNNRETIYANNSIGFYFTYFLKAIFIKTVLILRVKLIIYLFLVM